MGKNYELLQLWSPENLLGTPSPCCWTRSISLHQETWAGEEFDPATAWFVNDGVQFEVFKGWGDWGQCIGTVDLLQFQQTTLCNRLEGFWRVKLLFHWINNWQRASWKSVVVSRLLAASVRMLALRSMNWSLGLAPEEIATVIWHAVSFRLGLIIISTIVVSCFSSWRSDFDKRLCKFNLELFGNGLQIKIKKIQ